jgi:pimeloyl-ACP methyl ester carboxylesterase
MLGPLQSSASAGEVATELVEGYGLQVLAPDAPGFGRSPPLPAERYRPSSVADLARDILDALELETIDWIGTSWGGTVGCYFAERHRDRLRRLVLLDVGYQEALERRSLEEWIESRRPLEELHWESWDAFAASAEESIGPVRPPVLAAMREALRDDDGLRPILTPEVAGAVLWGVAEEPPSAAQLARADVDVLLVAAGDADEDLVARFRETLPRARVHGMPDAGHDLLGEAGPELVPLLGNFLASAPGRRGSRRAKPGSARA